MDDHFIRYLEGLLANLKPAGLYKQERCIQSPQNSHIILRGGTPLLNFCANNYLGLADSPELINAAIDGLKKYGYGMASVRFICGTQTIHKELEQSISSFLQTEDTILYSSCFDANGGAFETLFGEQDAIISDSLNHASIIDGIRLCKAQRFRYNNNDMNDLEQKLKEAKSCRFKLIVTDGVFSMDGIIANLKIVCDLAEKYNAIVMVDDSHGVGVMGENGQGTPEFCGVTSRIDIFSGTLGKALGGASGGYLSGKKEIIDWLRQRSRPYLFSNTLAPPIAAASIKAIEIVQREPQRRKKLHENTRYFREKMTTLGFQITEGIHPIIPVILGEAKLAQAFAEALLDHGIYVVGFFYPVVPEGKARIRIQMSAAHSIEEMDKALEAFKAVGHQLGVI